MVQGYLATEEKATVRVRIAEAEAWLTIKGRRENCAAPEFEYPIPLADAEALLEQCAKKPFIEKTRHYIKRDGLLWEVDEFAGANEGLILAEVELASSGQFVARPPWLGREVTNEHRYANSSLAFSPYTAW